MEDRRPTTRALKAAAKAAKPKPAPVKRPRKTQPVLDDVLLEQLMATLDAPLAPVSPPAPASPPAPVSPPVPVRATPPPAPHVPPESPPLWAHLVADPGYAAEHLAREAVRRMGPDARDWVERMRLRYPAATPDALARLAGAELVRTARRLGAGSAFGGSAGSWAAVAILARTQARLVLTVAAAYGLDPMAEARTRDILDLLRVPRLTQPARVAGLNGGRLLAGVAIRQLAARVLPLGAGVAGALHSGRSTEAVANRAVQRFRPGNDNGGQRNAGSQRNGRYPRR